MVVDLGNKTFNSSSILTALIICLGTIRVFFIFLGVELLFLGFAHVSVSFSLGFGSGFEHFLAFSFFLSLSFFFGCSSFDGLVLFGFDFLLGHVGSSFFLDFLGRSLFFVDRSSSRP